MNTNLNPILNTDSYKCSQYLQYPENTKFIQSYVSSRVSEEQEIVHMGTALINEYFQNTRITQENINEAESIITSHGEPFNKKGWQYILDKYDGRLPLIIKALPDGEVVRGGTPQVTVINEDENLPWLVGYFETEILRCIWYASTVATRSREMKKMIKANMEKTCDTLDKLPFMLHDFGARGVETRESAANGGVSHLVNFMGTDTLQSIERVMQLYNTQEVVGFSIPASEHSTITSWTRDNEIDAYRNMVKQFGKKGSMFACVSDSYDIFNAIENIWKELEPEIIESGATLIIRPDSGHPVEIVEKCLEVAGETFGFTMNSKGYKMLPNHIRLIQGDGVSLETLNEILVSMDLNNWSLDNIAFGMGAELLQKVNRDTYKYAMKACAISLTDNKPDSFTPVFKDPVTDRGKKSYKDGFIVDNRLEICNGIKDNFEKVRSRASL